MLLTPEGEVDVPLVLLLGDQGLLVLGQSTSDSSGLLVSQVKGQDYGKPIWSARSRVSCSRNVHLEFLVLSISRTFCLCFWLMTVKTRAMDFRVVLLRNHMGQQCSLTYVSLALALASLASSRPVQFRLPHIPTSCPFALQPSSSRASLQSTLNPLRPKCVPNVKAKANLASPN